MVCKLKGATKYSDLWNYYIKSFIIFLKENDKQSQKQKFFPVICLVSEYNSGYYVVDSEALLFNMINMNNNNIINKII